MRLTLGKSYKNGIDLCFSYNDKKYIVCARRDEKGQIFFDESRKTVSKEKSKGPKQTAILMVVSLIISLLYTATKNSLGDSIAGILLVLGVLGAMYLGIYLYSKKQENQIMWRYHAAEHMAMNYFERYEKAPKNMEELSKMSKIYISCGSTILTFIILTLFAQFINFLLIKQIIVNILLLILSVAILFIMWGKGYFDFVQELVVKNPSEKELEVAMAALIRMQQIIKEQDPEYDD